MSVLEEIKDQLTVLKDILETKWCPCMEFNHCQYCILSTPADECPYEAPCLRKAIIGFLKNIERGYGPDQEEREGGIMVSGLSTLDIKRLKEE